MGADGSRVLTFCFSILLHIKLDVINLAMCISSAFIYKFSFGKPGRRITMSPTSASRTVVCNHISTMRQFSTIILLTFLFACNQTPKQKSNTKTSANADTTLQVDDSLKLVIEKHGDTVYKHFIDPDSTKGDNFDDSYNVKSVYKTVLNDTTIKSNLFFSQADYKVFLNPKDVINFCDKSIKQIKEGKSLDYDEKSFNELKIFAQSYLTRQNKSNPFDYDWLPALLLNCKFAIVNTKTKEKPKAVIIEYYRTEFSGGKNFYLLTPKGDTLSFIHDMDWIS